MAHLLLTFLGRVAKDQGSYRTTAYDFGDGQQESPTAFFGWPLQRRLQPDKLVVLGTAGSMWDHLFEGDLAFEDEQEDARLALQEAVDQKQVSASHLAPLAPLLSERLGCEVVLDLIPYCRNEAEQVQLLDIMAGHVDVGDRVDLDVTHGFRHLPMVALLAALHLRMLRRAEIAGIWYGTYDPDTKQAPVYNLGGLLHIADWLQALHTFDKDGDYGALAPLLGPAGALLQDAAFFERTTNPVKAREKLTGWVNRDDRVPADDPAAGLFSDALHERIRWYRGGSRAGWERSLAWEYLERRDYVRAAIYGLESVISAEVERRGESGNDYDLREAAAGRLSDKWEFRALKNIRNALAHGVRPRDKKITHAIRDEQTLYAELRSLLKALA
jgi:CRISPR-associated Csx2 family protein